MVRGEDPDRVGTDCEEPDMAERHLAGKPEQHVEADPDDGGQAHHGDEIDLVAIAEQRTRYRKREERGGARNGKC